MDARLEDFQRIAESDEHFFRGMEVHRDGKYKRAIQLYGMATELRPEASLPLLFRARAHFEEGDFANAIKDCNTALDIVPEDSAALNMRGVAKYGSGDIDGAVEEFEHLMETREGFPWPYINRALIVRNRDGMDAGLKEFKAIAERFPKSSRVFDSLGVLTYELGDRDQALEYFDVAVANSNAANFPFPHAFLNRSILRKELGDAEGAAADEKKYKEFLNQTSK